MALYKFTVEMTCSGCSGAVERVLKRLDGVTSVRCDLKSQTVEVEASVDRELVRQTIAKTGKQVQVI